MTTPAPPAAADLPEGLQPVLSQGRKQVFKQARGLGLHLGLVLSLGMAPGAQAQVADVVRPSASGDFVEVQREGPRGPVPQRLWLVVDRDPAGLLCRDAKGHALLALRPGAVLEADAGPGLPTPLQTRSGRPYLRLRVKPVDILSDRRIVGPAERRQEHERWSQHPDTICQVRAHGAYLAPVLVESLQALPATIRGR